MKWSIAQFSTLLRNLAGVALSFMMLLTVADVLLRNAFDSPIFGSVEIVRGTLAFMVFFGIPETFLRRGHVTVDIADHLFSERVIGWSNAFAQVLTLVFMVVTLWTMLGRAHDSYSFGDVTTDLSIPLIWFWVPLLIGGLCSVFAVLLLTVEDIKKLLTQEG